MNPPVPIRRLVLATAACAVFMLAADSGRAVQATAAEKGEAEKKPPKLEINAPPENARKVRFTTQEGTWISLDVTPDGRAIYFDLLGDLYRIPIAGGRATRLTSGPAFDYAPKLSPDGKTVVFCSDRGGNMNLWLMDADGSRPRPLTEEKDAVFSSPSWTPDGLYVLARKENTSRAGIPPVELVMIHRDGGGGVTVISKDKMNNVAGPVASPEGRFIYFSGRERRFSYLQPVEAMAGGLWNLYRFDRVTGTQVRLTPGPNGGLRPTLSPDGRKLAYMRRDDAVDILVLRDLESGAERVLSRGLTRDEEEGFAQMDLYPTADFTPDGKFLVLYSGGKIHQVAVADGKEAEIPFTADVALDLRPLQRVEKPVGEHELPVKLLRWPTLSPDGRRLVFDALGKLWSCQLQGGKADRPRRLTRGTAREYAPEFSPDGRFIAYVTWSDADLGNVWKISAEGGTPLRLTRHAGHYVNPAWSPKGDRIVFVAGSGAELRGQQPESDTYYEIRWVPAAAKGGGEEARTVIAVTPTEALRFHPIPTWSADGERIFFEETIPAEKPYTDDKTDLVSVRLDGTDKHRHLRFRQVEDAVPSPDGAWVAFVRADDVYVTAFPRAGSDPVEIGFGSDPVPVYRLSTEGGGYLGWADGGKTIVWGMAGTVYRQSLQKVRDAIQKQQEEKRKAEAAAPSPPGARRAIKRRGRSRSCRSPNRSR